MKAPILDLSLGSGSIPLHNAVLPHSLESPAMVSTIARKTVPAASPTPWAKPLLVTAWAARIPDFGWTGAVEQHIRDIHQGVENQKTVAPGIRRR